MVSKTMNNEQATARNADKFRTDLSILNDAAVGVVMCRTREPYRAIDSIRGLALARKLPTRVWTVVKGWEEFTLDGNSKSVNAVKDPNMALQAMGGIDGSTNEEGHPGLGEGFHISMYVHHWLKPGSAVPAIIQTIKEYCQILPHRPKQRLILLAPPGFSLPAELEEDITILDFDVPSYAELARALDDEIADLNGTKDNRPKLTSKDKDRIISAGAGMQMFEFVTAFSRAIVTHRDKLPDVPIDDLVGEVMKVKVEVVKRSEVLEVMPVVDMDSIGGLDNIKEWLAERANCFGQEAKDYGIEAPRGIALIGPPGTGKSLLAKGTAHALGHPLIKFDISRVFAGLVGESEARVRAALKMIDSMAPCVAMLDEVDKAFQRSSGGDSGVSQRVLGAVLTHMQESTAGVFWVATANRVDNLPSEFLRRGRLDEVFSVSVPDADERLEIIKIHLRLRNKNPDDVGDLDVAVAKSEGFVPAELEAAVKDAIIKSFANGKTAITGHMIGDQFDNMKPLSEAFEDDFRAMQLWAENNARPASRNRPTPSRRRRAPVDATGDAGRKLVLNDA